MSVSTEEPPLGWQDQSEGRFELRAVFRKNNGVGHGARRFRHDGDAFQLRLHARRKIHGEDGGRLPLCNSLSKSSRG
jgi:hypothetical protein